MKVKFLFAYEKRQKYQQRTFLRSEKTKTLIIDITCMYRYVHFIYNKHHDLIDHFGAKIRKPRFRPTDVRAIFV